MVKLGNDWDDIIGDEFKKDYFLELSEKLKHEYNEYAIFPARENVFNALKFTPYSKTKVLLLGQDPYHGEGQAHGLAFSVPDGVAKPPSLVNMLKELKNNIDCDVSGSGCLIPWAKQGVMLLNTVLTVREGQANSHKKLGWTTFTDRIISCLNEREDPVIFMLWGNNASEKLGLITNPRHFVLMAPHPSPLSASRGFLGCAHYSKVNKILERLGKEPIDWSLRHQGIEHAQV